MAHLTLTAAKHGITHEDHHFKHPEQGYQKTPPPNLKAMYDYLPSEPVATSPKKVPKKLELSAPNPEAATSILKGQMKCAGVYCQVPNKEARNGYPVFKHVDEDLAIFCSTFDGEQCWVVAQFTTMDTKERVCMRVMGGEMPIDSKAATWKAFQGNDNWEDAVGIKLKPSYHGFNMEAKGQSQNTESSVSPKRLVGGKKGPSSPS